MQFLRSKKEAYLNQIDSDINLMFLKAMQLLGMHSEDLSFSAFLKQNPHYTKYHDYNALIQDYSSFLHKTLIVLTSEFYEHAYSNKMLKHRLFANTYYLNTIYKYALQLEEYINVARENHISNAIATLTSEDILPESALH